MEMRQIRAARTNTTLRKWKFLVRMKERSKKCAKKKTERKLCKRCKLLYQHKNERNAQRPKRKIFWFWRCIKQDGVTLIYSIYFFFTYIFVGRFFLFFCCCFILLAGTADRHYSPKWFWLPFKTRPTPDVDGYVCCDVDVDVMYGCEMRRYSTYILCAPNAQEWKINGNKPVTPNST